MLAKGAIYTDQSYHLRKDKEYGLGFSFKKNLLTVFFLIEYKHPCLDYTCYLKME